MERPGLSKYIDLYRSPENPGANNNQELEASSSSAPNPAPSAAGHILTSASLANIAASPARATAGLAPATAGSAPVAEKLSLSKYQFNPSKVANLSY